MKKDFPKHIAIIMDGNRRWARKRGLPEEQGHRAGAEALGKIVEAAIKLGVETITVYALSTENLEHRAKRELGALFHLLTEGLTKKAVEAKEKNIKLEILGETVGLPDRVQQAIAEVRKVYIENEAIRINIALNYGGRDEIVRAVKKMLSNGIDLDKITEQAIKKHLDTGDQGPPELVIRTGGMIRLSNFLLWQTAYSELYFTKKLWPDFVGKDLARAINWYQQVKRNFGK